MKKINVILCIAAFSMLAIGCAKDGAMGPAGATGPTGPAGAPGATGTANVIYSDWFNFKLSDYKDTTLFHIKQNALRAIKLAPSLTATHLSSAVILSYVAYKPQVAQHWFAPLPWIYDDGSTNFQLSFTPQTGKFIYHWIVDGGIEDYTAWGSNSADWGLEGNLAPADNYFRYVIIPGGAKATSNVANTGYTLTQLKSMNGEQIEKIFKIPSRGTNITK